MIKPKCECCGFEQEFEDEDAADAAGWDVPPAYTITVCNLCPATNVLGLGDHTHQHEKWQAEGRPATFEETLEKADIKQLAEFRERLDAALDGLDAAQKSIKAMEIHNALMRESDKRHRASKPAKH